MPDIELGAPEIDDIDDSSDRFKKVVALVVVTITFFGTLVGYLQNQASNKEEVMARDSQIAAVTGFGTQIDANARYNAAYDVYAEDRLIEQRQLLAHTRSRLLLQGAARDELARETARLTSIRDALGPLSPLLSDARYTDEKDPAFPSRFFADVAVEADRAQLRQMARSELVNDYGGKADAYVAVLTVLAVALFLVGLSLTVSGRGRKLLFVPGVGLALWCLGWTLLITARPISDTPVRAINAVAEGNRLLSQQDHEGAIESFTKAIEARPDYGFAFGRRADAFFLAGSPQRGEDFVSITDPEHLAKSIEDSEAAIAHGEEGNLSVVGSLGFNYFLDGDYDDAAARTDDAIAINDGLPQLWFNRGVIALAQQDEGAEDFYRHALRLLEDVPYEYVRSDLFRAARTDLEILAVQEPELRDDVAAFQQLLVRAESEQRAAAADATAAPDASITELELMPQGNAVAATYFTDDIPAGAEIVHVWMRRPDRRTPFSEPRFMTSFEVQTEEEAERGSRSTAAAPGGCAIDAQYRLDVYVDGTKRASGSLDVAAPTMGELTAARDDAVGVSMCRPVEWSEEEDDDPGIVQFSAPDGSAGLSLGVFALPAELAAGGPAATADALIAAAVGGTGARPVGGTTEYYFAGFDGRAQRLTSSDGVLIVAAAVADDGLARVVIAAAPNTSLLTKLEEELLPSLIFDVGV